MLTRHGEAARGDVVLMDYSLRKLMAALEAKNEEALAHLVGMEKVSFPTGFAFAAANWEIPADQTLVAYFWAWLENQVMAAVKIVLLARLTGSPILLTGQAPPNYRRSRSIGCDGAGCYTDARRSGPSCLRTSRTAPASLPSENGYPPTLGYSD